MSTARAPCPDCQLPFYTERNTECPYCGAGLAADDGPAATADDAVDHGDTDTVVTTPAGSVARTRPPERPRTTCAHCGLPHYADTGNGCPYCDAAGRTDEPSGGAVSDPDTGAGDVTPAGGADTAPDTGSDARSGRAEGERSGGILASLKRLVGR